MPRLQTPWHPKRETYSTDLVPKRSFKYCLDWSISIAETNLSESRLNTGMGLVTVLSQPPAPVGPVTLHAPAIIRWQESGLCQQRSRPIQPLNPILR